MTPSSPCSVQCRCGFRKGDPHIHDKQRYNLWGWLALLTGITARPIEIVYQCMRCDTVLDRTRDPLILGQNRR